MNGMNITKEFGSTIEKVATADAIKARKLLLTGYRARRLSYNILPNTKLPPSKRFVARAVMNIVINALSNPEKAAMVSIFTPCEPLLAAGITPYSVEALAGYLAGTKCEQVFLEHATGEGIPETMCSFHRVFLGAADNGIMPQPKFMIYTNLACDGNMITFPYLKRKYNIPSYFIDVPYEKSEEAVRNVALQLREMVTFIEDLTGKEISEEALCERVACSARTAENYLEYLNWQKKHRLPSDLISEMYGVFMSHILLGSKESEQYSQMLLRDIQRQPESQGIRLLWIHLIPYLQPSANGLLNFNNNIFISANELAYESMIPMDPTKPYETMARRLVYSGYNGEPNGRAAQALEMAKRTGAEGVVVFAQWGCKSTIGAAQLIKNILDREGLPTLILDGDCCDTANCSDGQVATRLEAFLEMLEDKH